IEGLDDPDAGIEDGTLHIPCHELRQRVFEPVINQVIDLIEEQVQLSSIKLDAIFLVGGFGQSTYLYRRVLAEFQSRVGFIGVPPRGELAVVRGAVYFGLNPHMVTERVSRRTYGLETRMVFDPRHDPPEQCIKGDDNRLFYLFAYDGDGPIPRLTTHPNVFKVARFPIKMPKFADVQKGQPVFMTIKMYFGQTEIKIEAQIRDRKFTFTSAFETMEREMMQSLNSQTNMLSIKPDEEHNSLAPGYGNGGMYGYTGSSAGSNVSAGYTNQSRPPSLPSRDNGYPSPMSNPRSDNDNTFYDGDSRHSASNTGSSRKIFGIKFGKKR
ncbi:hypothetical protein CU098_003290, partial [Rhizopus stolonifer]